ncbi:MAG TPA: response regulator [Vicinamibacterales bacterium]
MTLPGSGAAQTQLHFTGAADSDPLQQFVERRRQRFIETFDAQCDTMRALVEKLATSGLPGPVASLKRAAHRLGGMAGTVGFPLTSARASEIEGLVDRARQGAFDPAAVLALINGLTEALRSDLARPVEKAAPAPAAAAAPAVTPIRILIVDDHALLRCGLRALLTAEFPGAAFGEACDAATAMTELRKSAWDLALIDIALPGKSGLDLLRDVKSEWPSLPVLVLSGHTEDHVAVRALKSGAKGYISKDSAPEDLVKAVGRIAAGGRYVTDDVAERLALDTRKDSNCAPHESLSHREYEVMTRIAAGRTVTEIAEELSLSVKTISTYRARVLEKLGVKNNAEIVQYALRCGLVK